MRILLTVVSAFAFASAGPAAGQKASTPKPPERIESPVLFFPSQVQAGERSVRENEVFLTIPLHWSFAGTLERDVEVVAGEHRATLRAGEVLPKVLIPVPGKPDDGRFLFCTRNKVVEKRQGDAPIAQLVDALRDSLRDAQFCVEDTDGDGKVDRAAVFGKGSPELPGAAITPTAVTELTNEPIPGDKDVVKIALDTVGDKRSFLKLDILQYDQLRVFSSMVSGRFTAEAWPKIDHRDGLPKAVTLLGIKVTLLSAERKTNTARLRWEPAARPEEFVIIPRVTNVSSGY